jgi:hypothetical protein
MIPAYPQSFTIKGNGERIEEENLVEFRLLYEGELRPTSNKGHPEETHAIRRSFHPQLRRLWKINQNLKTMAQNEGLKESQRTGPATRLTMDEYFDLGVKNMGRNWNKADYDLVPLVTFDMVLRCSLDILLLRPEGRQYISNQGDIDGQLKTLFDALRRPDNMNETGKSQPQDDEMPLFCLLEDDKLISEVRVTSDQLLLLSNQKEIKANDAFVLIHVKLNHKDARTFNNVFG